MKTKIITIAAVILMSTGIAQSANNFRMFKIHDALGNTFCITMKEDKVNETLEFDTKAVFNNLKKENTVQMIDIRPFVKQEKEVEEYVPGINTVK
jgi:hypothetical protein